MFTKIEGSAHAQSIIFAEQRFKKRRRLLRLLFTRSYLQVN